MAGKKLVLITKPKPSKGQHTQPCSDCPWARVALPGWLGGELTAEDWVVYAHSEAPMWCHVFRKTECAGAAIYRANVAKLPRDKTLLRLPRDPVRVFGNRHEFFEHHNGGEGKIR